MHAQSMMDLGHVLLLLLAVLFIKAKRNVRWAELQSYGIKIDRMKTKKAPGGLYNSNKVICIHS